MSTMLQNLVTQFTESESEFDGVNDYRIADQFLKSHGIRATNKQVWTFINEVQDSAGEEADW